MKLRSIIMIAVLLNLGACSKKGKNLTTLSNEASSAEVSKAEDSSNSLSTIVKKRDVVATELLETKNNISVEINQDVANEDISILDEEIQAEVLPVVETDLEVLANSFKKNSDSRVTFARNANLVIPTSEVILVRTFETANKLSILMRTNKLLEAKTMTTQEYLDYLVNEASDCEEAQQSIFEFADKHNFKVERKTYYDEFCDCEKLVRVDAFEVIELVKTYGYDAESCPDDHITFKTCMDPTGKTVKNDTLYLDFSKARALNQGEYEIYKINLEQKKLGSKQLNFRVVPVASHTRERKADLLRAYNIKQGGILKSNDKISISKK